MSNTHYWAVIPAAGSGSRMAADRPKQYLVLCDKTVIEHTLTRLSRHPNISGTMVAISPTDDYWPSLGLEQRFNIRVTYGGKERCHSVSLALKALSAIAAPEDWVLVHDAARPCLRSQDIDRLIAELDGHPVGGLLALPVRDTMKRADINNEITTTVDRKDLWHALTPQMFRLADLSRALEQALLQNRLVTDEAEAMEMLGLAPKLVEGQVDNIKITRPQDLQLAELYLRRQEEECA